MTATVANLMRDFWDEKARENAPFYIATQERFWDADMAEFFASGEADIARILKDARLTLSGDERVVEIGCGIGRLSRALARRAREVHAVDISPEMLARARELNADLANVTFHQGSGVDLGQFADASFDFAFTFIVLQHIPDPAVVLNYVREMGRVLGPGGRALFQLRAAAEGPAPRPKPARGPIAAAAPVERVRGSGYDSPAWLGSAVTMADLRRAVAAGGMALISTRGAGTQYTWVRCEKPRARP